MARRDVDLVIKARNQAGKVVESITNALNEFTAAQTRLDSKSEETESALSALGAAIGRLDKELKTISGADRLTSELTKAEGALSRLENGAETTAAELAELRKQQSRTTAETDRFTAKMNRAAAAQKRQSASIKEAKNDQRELTRAYEQANTAQSRLQARQAKLPAMIERQAAAAAKAAARYDDLSAQIAGTERPSRSLQEQFEASARNVARTSSRLSELREEYSGIGGSIRAAQSAMALFDGQARQAADNLARQQRALDRIDTNYSTLKQQASSAGTQQTKLARDIEKVEASLTQQQRVVERARDDYARLAASSTEAQQALSRFSGESLGALTNELRAQRKSVLEAKRDYVGLREETTRLGRAMAQTAEPTAQMRAEFERSQAALKASEKTLLDQRVAYEAMSRTLVTTTSDYASVRAAQERFEGAQKTLKESVEKTNASLKKQQGEINQLHGVTGRSAGSNRVLATEQERLARANDRAAGSTGRLAAAYRQFYGDTRQSLSLLQRIRGEVLSLVAAYGGLYGAIEVLRGTVDATQQLEAAQSRLGVAFDQDQTRVGQELDFLRRTADRLGVEFGTLATEYSKFNIAAKNTALEGDAARRVFVQVAEAARVNRSSTRELSGVFTALTQIVSKGAVQMEELRQQLGDRLPGALQIMADGLGVTTAELVKMMEQGEITEAALIPFAEELRRRFGAGLPEALESLTVSLGRLQNAAFEALVQFGEQGFIEGFQTFVEDLTDTLRSADFAAFSANVSSALGRVVELLGFFARNFQILTAAAAGFIGLRLTPLVIAVAGAFRDAARAGREAAGGIATAGNAGSTAAVGLGRAAGAVRGLSAALRALLSSTGIGLAVAAISGGIAAWATEADKATEALIEHRDMVNQVRDAYDAAEGSIEGWREGLEDITAEGARENLRDLQDAIADVTGQLTREAFEGGELKLFGLVGAGVFTQVGREYQQAVYGAIRAFNAGEVSAAELRDRIDEISSEFNNGEGASRRLSEKLDDLTTELVKLEAAAEEAEAIVKAKTGTDEDAADAARDLALANEEVADSYDAGKADAYQASMTLLRDIIEETSEKSKELELALKIEGAFDEAIANAQTLEERLDAVITKAEALDNVAQSYVDSEFGSFGTGNEAAAAFIRKEERFSDVPYFDVNAYRAGYGSDTVTRLGADGKEIVVSVVEGMRVTYAEANRDLARRIREEFRPIAERAVGSENFASLSPQQQASLISIAYNSGFIPKGIAQAIRQGGSAEQVAAAITADIGRIQGLGQLSPAEKKGVSARRRREAALFRSDAGEEAAIREQERQDEQRRKQLEKEAEEREERRAATAEQIADNEFEIDQQQRLLEGKEREAAIREAIREARADDPDITEEEIALIREQTGRIFDLEQAKKNSKTASEQAKDAEAEVNQLLARRQALQEQLKLAEEKGDRSFAADLKDDIAGVNSELVTAIDNAIRMWEAVGGAEADAAIEKLNLAKLQAQDLDLAAEKNYLDWTRVSDLFVTGLASAFDTFAQKIAQGENAFAAARDAFLQFAADFLRQIAMMIIQQAIFNALKSAFGGTPFGNLIGLPAGHTGGVVGSKRVGSGNQTRRVNPAVFAAAARYHIGGIAGLRPGEVPMIAKQGEEVLTRDDPRHVLNQAAAAAGGAGAREGLTIINAVDGGDAVEKGLSSPKGQKAFMNYIRSNADAVNAELSRGRS